MQLNIIKKRANQTHGISVMFEAIGNTAGIGLYDPIASGRAPQPKQQRESTQAPVGLRCAREQPSILRGNQNQPQPLWTKELPCNSIKIKSARIKRMKSLSCPKLLETPLEKVPCTTRLHQGATSHPRQQSESTPALVGLRCARE